MKEALPKKPPRQRRQRATYPEGDDNRRLWGPPPHGRVSQLKRSDGAPLYRDWFCWFRKDRSKYSVLRKMTEPEQEVQDGEAQDT